MEVVIIIIVTIDQFDSGQSRDEGSLDQLA